MAVLGLRFCARAFSSCGKRGSLFIAVRGPLTIVASLVAEHRLQMAGGFLTTAPPGKSLDALNLRCLLDIQVKVSSK